MRYGRWRGDASALTLVHITAGIPDVDATDVGPFSIELTHSLSLSLSL